MNSRSRVLAALKHEPHDRIPVDLGGTVVTGICPQVHDALRRELGLRITPSKVIEPVTIVAEVEAPLRKALEIDTITLCLEGGSLHGWQPWKMSDGTEVQLSSDLDVKERGDGGWNLIRAGKTIGTMPPGGLYFDELEYVKWRDYDPGALTDEVLKDIEIRARFCKEETDLAVVLNTPFSIFNGTNPEFLCALMIDDEKQEAHDRMNTWVDHTIEGLRLLLDAVSDNVSVMVFSGDAGTQRAPIISPDLYREMILPHFRRVPEFVHKNSDIHFFLHTCGSVYRLMEPFIEEGVDILNPLQVSAAEMEAERIVSEFGGRIAFWGGGIDAQHTLVEGTEEQVRAKVRNQLSQYASIPGYVFAFDHNLQADVPAGNILAAIDEVRRFTLKEVEN